MSCTYLVFFRHCFSCAFLQSLERNCVTRRSLRVAFQSRRYSSEVRNVRVRFAPSPTGYLHLGGLRTALYNYMFSKSNGGTFVLRIEDTDQTRVVAGSQENLESMLEWIGLTPDESPSKGGEYGPYIQSQRTSLYKEKAYDLLEKGAAYRCFCSEVRLSILRKEAIRNHETPRYDNKCRYLSKDEIEEHLSNKKPFVIRLKMTNEPVTFNDVIYGPITLNLSEREGDPVILKSDSYPTYHLACVVDDHLMKITHVLRGVEWQVSTPKHLMLYDAFDWKPPIFAHLPLIMNKDGTKLSKRQGDIQVSHFRDNGYAPIAILNFICGVGGGFGKQGEPEILPLDELAARFSLSRVNSNSCRLEPQRLEMYNRLALSYLLKEDKTARGLIEDLRMLVEKSFGKNCGMGRLKDDSYVKRILEWSTTRINKLSDLVAPDMKFIWIAPNVDKLAATLEDFNVEKVLASLIHDLEVLPSHAFEKTELVSCLKAFSNENEVKFSTLMQILRIILMGSKQGPAVGEIMELIGQQETLSRLKAAIRHDKKVGSATASTCRGA